MVGKKKFVGFRMAEASTCGSQDHRSRSLSNSVWQEEQILEHGTVTIGPQDRYAIRDTIDAEGCKISTLWEYTVCRCSR